MNRYLIPLLLCFSIFVNASELTDKVKSRADQFVAKGVPVASSYYHDSGIFQISAKYGYPGVPMSLRFIGSYGYMYQGEWVSESITRIVIDWGDGNAQTFTPSSWPLNASHTYGYQNYRVTVKEETSYEIQMTFTTTLGHSFIQKAEYVIHMNDSGVAAPSTADNEIKHYWENANCTMINDVCYEVTSTVTSTSPVDVSLNLSSAAPWSLSAVTYYSGVAYTKKSISCSSPYHQEGSKCFYTESATERFPAAYELVSSLPSYSTVYHDTALEDADIVNAVKSKAFFCKNGYLHSRIGWYGPSTVASLCYSRYTLVYCPEDYTRTYSNGVYYCSITTQGQEVHNEEWETCHSLDYADAASYLGTTLSISTNFSCFSSIIVKNVCYSPYIFNNGVCSYETTVSTPVDNATSGEIPRDAYKR